MTTTIDDTPIAANGDGQSESHDRSWDSWLEFRANQKLDDRERAARQLRNAVRRVVKLHAAEAPDLNAADWATFRDVCRFIKAVVDEIAAHERFEQLELGL